MTITERQAGTVTILDVDGQLKMEEGAPQLAEAIRRLLAQGRTKIVLNVANVPFVDSSGLGALVQAHVSVTRVSGALRLSGTPRRLRELIAITKLTPVLPSFDDEAAALANF
jgi:anti-sigma B factor antagonist